MKKPLTILFVVLLVGFVSWDFWHSRVTAPTYNQPQAGSTTSNTTPEQTSNPVKPAKYLDIKEWGVRLPLPDNANPADLYYRIVTDDGVEADALIGSRALTAADSDCDVNKLSATIMYAIARQTASERQAAQQNPDSAGAARYKVSNYYYDFRPGQDSCYAANNTQAVAAAKQLPDFSAAVIHIQPLPN